jgi:hypothetical protein
LPRCLVASKNKTRAVTVVWALSGRFASLCLDCLVQKKVRTADPACFLRSDFAVLASGDVVWSCRTDFLLFCRRPLQGERPPDALRAVARVSVAALILCAREAFVAQRRARSVSGEKAARLAILLGGIGRVRAASAHERDDEDGQKNDADPEAAEGEPPRLHAETVT